MSSQPEAPNLKPGDVVAGRFRIVESIGSGGFSVVYRAHQEDQNRFVALKVLKPDASSDDDIVERFRREALYASHLSHPNTITLFDYGHTDEGLCYIAMEHLEGCDLADIVKHGEPMDLRRVWSILMQTSRSLAEAHQIGLVHRDLKPENIFLVQRDGSEEMVKVLDFGVSKAISNFGDRGVETMKPLTQQGTVFGTPLYMAPEQAMAEDITPAVDVYALGHIAYEMITGEAAYLDCSTAMDVMLKQINEPPLSLPKPWAQTPFSALITRCTIKDPDERIADASVLLEHLMHEAFSGYVSDVRRTGRTHSLPNVATQTDEGTIEEPSQPLASNEIESVYRWELDALDEVLEEVVTQGQMRLVLVRGTPGSGRSNLLRAFLQRRLDSTDQLAVAHRPRTEDAGLAADLAAVTSTDIEGRGVDELRRMLSAAPVDDVAAESNPQTDSAPLSALGARRDKLLVRVGEAFRHAANSSGGLIWAIESLERVDTLTLAFLEHLFEDLKRRPAPVLIVATVHPDDLRRRPGLLRYTQSLLRARRPVARQLEILPPGEDKAVDEEAPAPPEERGAPRPSGGSYVGDELPRLDRGIGAEASQPEEVFGDLRADSVPRRQEGELAFETILGFLSELGDRVDRDLWKLACARVIPDEFVGMIDFILQQAKRYGIIAEEEGAYVFTQEGYAEQLRASFDDLVDSAEVHRRLARLMREHSDSLERTELQAIVRHLRLGHAPFEAVELLREAGEAAFRSYDLDSARGYYLQIRQILEDVDRGRLPSEAERVELGERERAKIWLRLGEIHGAMDEHGAAEDAIGRTLAPDSGADAELRGRAYKILGDLAASQDRYDRAKLEYRRARDSFREAGHPGAFAAAVGAMGHCALEQGKAREAEELVAMALERAAEIQNEMLGARLGRIMGRVLLIQGRIKEARTHFDRSSERFERVDSRREMAATLAELATATFADGHFDEARDNYERAQAIAGQERIELDESMELALARTHAAMGNLDRAQDHLRAALEGARVAGKRLLTARVEVHLGDLAAVRGDSERANEAYRRAESIAEEVGHTELHMRASIRRAYVRFTESNLAEALDQLGETMKRAKKVGDRSGELEVRAHVIHLQLLDRAFETRGGAFSSLLDKATREDLRRARLLCQIFRADVHVASEQFDAARRLLEAAREGAARAEHYTLLLPIAQRARRLPSQAGKTEQKATGAALGSLLPPEEHTLYG